MVGIDVVRELALDLPETEETTSYGTPAFKVRKKLFARMREEATSSSSTSSGTNVRL